MPFSRRMQFRRKPTVLKKRKVMKSTKARRRERKPARIQVVQALSGLGYSSRQIAERLKMDPEDVLRLRRTSLTRRGRQPQLPLTERQQQVLTMVWQGMPNREIGKRLRISRRTVEVHRAALMKRAGVHNAAQLLRWAIEQKLVPARPRQVA